MRQMSNEEAHNHPNAIALRKKLSEKLDDAIEIYELGKKRGFELSEYDRENFDDAMDKKMGWLARRGIDFDEPSSQRGVPLINTEDKTIGIWDYIPGLDEKILVLKKDMDVDLYDGLESLL